MYISRLKLENWKNFRNADAGIGHRLFLVGPNASGKSNLLDVFRFLRDLSVSGGGLQQAVDVERGGVSSLRCLAARQKSDICIEVEIENEIKSETNGLWTYRLIFNQDNNRRPVVKSEFVSHNGTIVLDRPDRNDKTDSLRLTETAIEQTSTNKGFRPVVEFFQSISYQHLIPQIMRDPQGFSVGRVDNDPFGRDFLQRVEKTTERTKNSRLTKISDALKIAVPQLESLKVERDASGVAHLIGAFQHWRPHPNRQNESQFSDGTLRLFGLLWTLFEGNGPLLLEEPELSLHSELVRHLPQIIERINRQRKIKRQTIISTHSSDMLNDSSIDADEVIRLEPSPEGTLLRFADESERSALKHGLSVADVILPKSAPANADQLLFSF